MNTYRIPLNNTVLSTLLKNSDSKKFGIQNALEVIRSLKQEGSSLIGRVSNETKEDFSPLFIEIHSSEFLELSKEMGYEDPLQCAHSLLEQALLNQIEVDPSQIFLAMLCNQINEIPQAPEDPIKFTGQLVEDFFAKITPDESVRRNWIHESERESWEEKIATWKNSFGTLMSQMEANEHRVLFSPDPEIRRNQYENFATRMLFFLLVLVEKEEIYDFFDRCVPDLLGHCYTRWDQEIFQLQRLAYPEMEKNQLLIPQLAARELRRKIVQYEVFPAIVRRLALSVGDQQNMITDVHYLAKLWQCANEEFGLGYAEEALGEPELLNEFKRVYDEEKGLFANSYSSRRIKLELSTYWERLSLSEKEFLIDYLVNCYRKAVLQETIPLTQNAEVLRFLYSKLKLVNSLEDITYLKALKREFQEAGVEFPLEIPAISTEEILTEFRTLSGSEKEKRRIDQAIKDIGAEREISAMIHHLEKIFPDSRLLDGLKNQDQWIEKSMIRINRSIEIVQESIEEKIALQISEEIKSKLAIRDELTPFGLSAWMVAGKVVTANDPLLSFLSEIGDLDVLLIGYLESHPKIYGQLSKKTHLNPVVVKMVQENPGLTCGVSKEQYLLWMQDPEGSFLADARSRNCREVVIEAVKIYPKLFKYVSEVLRKDRSLILELVKISGFILCYADESFKADRGVVFDAAVHHAVALEYAANELKMDRYFILEIATQNGMILQYVHGDLKKDKDVVLKAVSNSGEALAYASKELQGDNDVVFEAVSQSCWALEYASDVLKNDKKIVIQAVRQNYWVIQYASYELQQDSEVLSIGWR